MTVSMFKIGKGFSKNDLKACYDDHFEALRNFLYYKTGDMQLAEDLVQEVFIKVWEKRKSIDKERVKGLLYTIARNLLMNHFGHLKVVQSHQDEVGQTENEEKVTPEFIIEESEFKEKFEKVIAEMPEGSREVFLMNRIDGLSYQEIADSLDLSVKAIEKRMSKAINIIKEEIGRKV